jgi:hypothetical protein
MLAATKLLGSIRVLVRRLPDRLAEQSFPAGTPESCTRGRVRSPDLCRGLSVRFSEMISDRCSRTQGIAARQTSPRDPRQLIIGQSPD